MTYGTGSLRLWALISVVLLTAVGCGEEPQAPSTPGAAQAVSSLPLSFVQVSAGASHTCGITGSQLTYCWGDNAYGELGNGTTTSSSRPVRVAGSLKFVQISAGGQFTCGVTGTNLAYCWGRNSNGQLGFTSGSAITTRPVAVSGGHRFRQIRAGFSHTCAVTPFDVGFCWGKNRYGELGANSTVVFSASPLRVAGGLSWNRIVAGGHHTCGVTTGHLAYCWGRNDGSLGDGTFFNRRKPAAVVGGLRFSLIVAGGGGYDDEQNESPVSQHTCGVTTDSKAYCWGQNSEGELGTGSLNSVQTTPVAVAGTRRWAQVVAGREHTCGVTLANVALCWGFNLFGQNGNGTTNTSRSPVRVSGGLQFIAVTTGVSTSVENAPDGGHSCGLTTTNRVYCWGLNDSGQLGDGTTTQRLAPVAVVAP